MAESRDTPVQARIAELPKLPRNQLLELWEAAYQRPAPKGLRRELLLPFLAYKIQENAYGGLKRSTRAELLRIARDLEKRPVRTRKPRARVLFKPGTRLVRTWRGKPHEVAIAESGFLYAGTCYKSLSAIARKITGTQWSGPVFFGLRKSASPSGVR